MYGIWRKLRKFFALSGEERRCFLLAWGGLLAVDLALRIRPAWILSGAEDPIPGEAAPASERRRRETEVRVLAVRRAAGHHVLPMTCLRRALCLRWLLARRGIPSRLRIGVHRQEGLLDAHAWLEDPDGRGIGEPAPAQNEYAPLEDLSRSL